MVRLHFRYLFVDSTHQPASRGEVTFSLNWGDDPEHTVSLDRVQICGAIVGVSISLILGQERTGKLALVDWRTGESIMVRASVSRRCATGLIFPLVDSGSALFSVSR